ncbi:conserved hypothetical protein [Hyphomicrobium sp. GJ21]|uniref:hypothetical protein n=1 Tax=Hyphomicrobium sp. GJ21 TaxID=113574 RepID=UPI000622C26F|nr:hypothetical protein [Hyphomicrobium sp. GJ21]CEJ87572.1 conserved hypothetical protein [Hyphomicrobium sp. GJ21]
MAGFAEQSPRNTSPYFSFYQTLFDTIDTTSFFWQPYLKAIGGSQLELAGLQARQAQAVLRWTHQMCRASSPADAAKLSAELWQTMIGNCTDAAPRMFAVASTATQSVAPIVLPMPAKRSRDTLILLDREQAPTESYEQRKVA